MGAIHEKPLSDLVSQLKLAGRLVNFVETGTFVGNSLDWASQTFENVWTIEINPHFFAEAKARFHKLKNVNFLLGDSSINLESIVGQLEGPALFWLDAHAGAGFFADHDICPLIQEMETILRSPHEHLMIIDDARAFLAPPPPPFDYSKWPSLDQIFRVFADRPNYNIVAIADAIIIVPSRFRHIVANFCFSIRPKL
jgi:hypothetical protein